VDSGPPPTYSAAIHARRRQFSRAWLSRMRSGSLVELRHGEPRRLFLVHDGEGETLLYLNLARRLPDDLAVFAIEPRHIARVPLADLTIEDMAAFYISEARRKQPHGPYLLGGLCAGGVIAYEMARQLVQAGENVELVVLLETARPNAPERPGRIAEQRLGRLRQTIAVAQEGGLAPLKRACWVVGTISQKLVNALLWEILQRGKQWTVRARFYLLRQILGRKVSWPRFLPELSVRQIYDCAQARYVPKPLSISPVVLVRAQTGEGDETPFRDIYADESFGWNDFVCGLTLVDVDGGHSSLLHERFVDSLAKALLPYLQLNVGSSREPSLEVVL
jgi:thioesterase domain-containing protein